MFSSTLQAMAIGLDAALSARVGHAMVKWLGSLTSVALPSQITAFNVKQKYLFRLAVMLCACLSMTDFDVPASVALLVIYMFVSEWLQWEFPAEKKENAQIAEQLQQKAGENQLTSVVPGSIPWQWQPISALLQ